MNNNLSNPYQHNVDIIKGFFRKPIILALAILMAVSCICSMFSGMLLSSFSPSEMFSKMMPDNSSLYYSTIYNNPSFSINISATAILTTIAFFLLYFFSRSKTKKMNAPTKIFKIVTLIELIVVYVIFIAIIVAISIIFAIGLDAIEAEILKNLPPEMSYAYYAYFTGQMRHEIFNIICILLLIIFSITGAISVWISTMRYRFAKSIDDSIRGINLYKKGAMTYGVICIVAGSLSAITVPSLYVTFSPRYATTLLVITSIGAAVDIIMGIVAIKYAVYIKNISMNFTTEPVYAPEEMDDSEEAMPFGNIHGVTSHMDDSNPYAQTAQESANSYCTKCGNSVTTEDVFCNKCGNKLK